MQSKYPVAAMTFLFIIVATSSSFLMMQMKIGWQRAFTAAIGQAAISGKEIWKCGRSSVVDFAVVMASNQALLSLR